MCLPLGFLVMRDTMLFSLILLAVIFLCYLFGVCFYVILWPLTQPALQLRSCSQRSHSTHLRAFLFIIAFNLMISERLAVIRPSWAKNKGTSDESYSALESDYLAKLPQGSEAVDLYPPTLYSTVNGPYATP